MDIVPLPAFRDNYIWTLRDDRHAAVVDPGEPGPVRRYLQAEKLRLVAILATHHHPDHTGGIAELIADRRVPVFGPRGEPIPELSHPVGQGDSVNVPELSALFSVLDIPGHTRAHVAYYGLGALFCGDTLFACGCGRVFEGIVVEHVPGELHPLFQREPDVLSLPISWRMLYSPSDLDRVSSAHPNPVASGPTIAPGAAYGEARR